MGSRSSALVLLLLVCGVQGAPPLLGTFEGQQDIGTVLHSGSADYDPVAKTYTVTGSGENMWFASDAFHFVWKRMSGDLTLSSDVALLGEGGDPHRKAVLMIRQSLGPDSAYADVAVHGNGLTSLQVRDAAGAVTHEIESSESAPHRVSIVKQGDIFRILVDGAIAGGSMRASITGTYYVGIGVCAHNKDAIQKAVFSNLEIGTRAAGVPTVYSTIETINVASTDRRVSFVTPGRVTLESPDERGFPILSPDGKQLAFASNEGQDVVLRVMLLADNKSRVLARLPDAKGMIDAPSWSPDSKRLIFVSYQIIPADAQ